MVLLWRPETIEIQADSSAGIFGASESSKIKKFFIFVEISVMQSEKKENATIFLMENLGVRAFKFFFDALVGDGQSTEDSKDNEMVKKSLINKFCKSDRPEEKFRRALESILDPTT